MSGKVNFLELHNGRKMPIIGLGTWEVQILSKDEVDDKELVNAIDAALEIGYRHIDTAYLYCTEKAIGKVLKKWTSSGKIKREDLFITTKLPSWAMKPEKVEKYLKESLAALQLSYVDLYLLHHAVGLVEIDGDNVEAYHKYPTPDVTTDHVSVWKAMEAQVDAGRALSIGLSNFNARQVKRIVNSARIKPANLQVEAQLYCQQKELAAFCKALDITVCAFGPIGSPALSTTGANVPNLSPLADPVVSEIAKKYNRTPAQILLRHLIQHGIAVIPKSSNPKRLKENFQVLDFELKEDDIDRLDALDKGGKGRIFTENVMKGYVGHPENPFVDRY
ncbi:dihydrodiol dehydrogenase 3-like [Schistocerca piceifrons]|uniref:dihydrodiol dehydrogenase 3-like n=1 Tax=Schistocerca piceifrons TaxID=274613 RepID=UPI001F5F3730|nr:dihydrodiol dehydrogenase 3-like [Schistocerca piceifrons]